MLHKFLRSAFINLLLSHMLLTASGFFEFAYALSCNDIWYTGPTGVTYRYSDKLDVFTSHNGKTYAFAKGGIGGEMISAGVINGKSTLYGMPTFISTSYPGTLPPKVTDGVVQKMLVDVYGPLLNGISGAFVGAMNKNDGQGYVAMDGTGALPYYNWVVGEPTQIQNCKDAQGSSGAAPYVYMDPQGGWHTTCDTTLPALFEFNGTFDCAKPYTGTGSITGTGSTNISTGSLNNLKPCDTTNFEGYILINGNSYAITKNKLTWDAARQLAEGAGGKLAYIPDALVNDQLKAAFGGYVSTNANVTGNKFWIGKHDPAKTPSWCIDGTTGPCTPMPERFVWTNDTGSYTNWAAGQPDNYCKSSEISSVNANTCYGENYAAMASDGTWSDEGPHGDPTIKLCPQNYEISADGTQCKSIFLVCPNNVCVVPYTTHPATELRAIVMWREQLQCTTTIRPPTAPPVQSLELNAGQAMCSNVSKTDLKYCIEAEQPAVLEPTKSCSEGYVLSADQSICNAVTTSPCPNNACTVPVTNNCPSGMQYDEILKKCKTKSNLICPMDMAACNAVMEEPSCPTGTTLNPTTHGCEVDPVVTCPQPGYTWDRTIDKCVSSDVCPQGTLNPITDKCEDTYSSTTCAAPFQYDAARDVCYKPVECGSPSAVYVAERDRCEQTPNWLCPDDGYTYNPQTKACDAKPICASGTYNPGTDRCETTLGKCPDGYTWNSTLQTCAVVATCDDGGVVNSITDKCELAATPTCPSASWTLSADQQTCTMAPKCAGTGAYDGTEDLCLANTTTIDCSAAGYTYDPATKTCITPPDCPGGVYNATTNRCELAAGTTCPDPSLTYNPATMQCEKTPDCAVGTFSSVSNKCTESATCPATGSLNAATDRCEIVASATCPTGGWTLSATPGICELAPPCPGGTYDAANKICIAPTTSRTCSVTGYSYDSASKTCIKTPTCPGGVGTYNAATNRCELAKTTTCADSTMTYNATSGKCEKAPTCTTGTYNQTLNKCVTTPTCPGTGSVNGSTDQCETAAKPSCTLPWFYNSTSGKCELTPACVTGTYDTTTNQCVASISGTSCTEAGYTYNGTLKACSATPSCPGGTFNQTTDQCEAPASYSCPDPSYTYSFTKGRCEKTPQCSIGTYNSTYDLCLQPFTPSCDTANGYSYNATRGRCEKAPPNCASGIYNPVTNRCEVSFSCQTGFIPNPATGMCEQSAVANGVLFDLPIYDLSSAYLSYNSSNQVLGIYAGGQLATDGKFPLYGFLSRQPFTGSIPVYSSNSTSYVVSYFSTNSTRILRGYAVDTVTARPSTFKNIYNGTLWLSSSAPLNATKFASGTLTGFVAPNSGSFAVGVTTYSCPNGGTLNGTVCQTPPTTPATCPTGTTPNASTGKCEYSATGSLEGGTVWDIPVYRASYNIGYSLNAFASRTGTNLLGYIARTKPDGSCDGTKVKTYYPHGTSLVGIVPGTAAAEGCIASTSFPSSTSVKSVMAEVPLTTGLCPILALTTLSVNGFSTSKGTSCLLSGQTYISSVVQTTGSTTVYSCPNGGSLNGTICQVDPTCPSGTLQGFLCVGQPAPPASNPVCPNGTFDGTYDVCYSPSTLACPSGTNTDLGIGFCTSPAICTNGVLDGANGDVCTQTPLPACSGGYTQSGSTCVKSVTCPGTGTLDGTNNVCRTPANFSCPGSMAYSTGLDKCIQAADCQGGALDAGTDKCQKANGLACDSPYTLSGSVCQTAPVCGTLAFDPTSDKCVATPACSSGTLNGSAGKCQADPAFSCSNSTYTFDGTSGICIATAGCDGGGTISTDDYCHTNATFNCSNPYTYNAAFDTCTLPVACGTGGLNTSTNKCEVSYSLSCPTTDYSLVGTTCQASPHCSSASLVYDAALNTCAAEPACPSSTLNASIGKCQGTPNWFCGDATYAYNATDNICVKGAGCIAGGTIDFTSDICRTDATFNCETGYEYSPTLNKCWKAADCAPGTVNPLSDKCEVTTTLVCTSPAYTLVGSVCQDNPNCGAPGVYNSATDVCDGGANVCTAPTVLDAVAGVCQQPSTCSGTNASLNTSNDVCEEAATPDCGTWALDTNLTLCYSNPVCDPGQYIAGAKECQIVVQRECNSPGVWNDQTLRCEYPTSCTHDPTYALDSTVAYSSALNLCTSDTEHDCSSAPGTAYAGLPTTMCQAVPVCSKGVFIPDNNQCYNDMQTCPVGDYFCFQPKGSTEMSAPGVPLQYCSPNPCQTDTQGMIETNDTTTGVNDPINDGATNPDGTCAATVYLFPGKDMRCRLYDRNGQVASVSKLVVSVVLAATGVGAALGGALMGAMGVTGLANATLAAIGNALITMATTVIIDAGTGQLGTGTLMACGMTALTAVAQVASSYLSGTPILGEGKSAITTDTTTGLTTTTTNTGTTTLTATTNPAQMAAQIADRTKGMTEVFNPTVSSQVGTGVKIYAATADSSLAAGANYTQAFVAVVMKDGQAIISNLAVNVQSSSLSQLLLAQATKLGEQWAPAISSGLLSSFDSTKCCFPDKMSGGCEPNEFQEAQLQHSKFCHVIGDYCSSKFLGMCIVRKQTSCCFNSLLARIFHEQGRSQIPGFIVNQANGDVWGSVHSPQCRGFIPEEFQNLDFGQIDLAEYVDKVTADAEALKDDITSYMESVQTDKATAVQNGVVKPPAVVMPQ